MDDNPKVSIPHPISRKLRDPDTKKTRAARPAKAIGIKPIKSVLRTGNNILDSNTPVSPIEAKIAIARM